MNTLTHLLPEDLSARLGWTLVHFVWEGAAIALLLACALVLLRRRSPALRYWAGCAAMLLMVAAAGATYRLVPEESVAAAAARTAGPGGGVNAGRSGGTDVESLDGLEWVISRGEAATDVPDTPPWPPLGKGGRAVGAPAADEAVVASEPRGWATGGITGAWRALVAGRIEAYLPWLVVAWLVGMLGASLRLFGGWVQVQRARRRLIEEVAPQWQALLTELAARLSVSRPVRLLVSAAELTPMTFGWLRPVVLMPVSALTGLTPDQLRAVLAHELAHIRRYDYLVNLVQSAIETVLFYHPAVWWVSRRIRLEREHCCDDAAVEVCGGALRYARALERLETLRGGSVRFAAAANGASLLKRIQRLVAPPAHRSPKWSGWLAGVLPAVLAVGLVIGTGWTQGRGAYAAGDEHSTHAPQPISTNSEPPASEQRDDHDTAKLDTHLRPVPSAGTEQELQRKRAALAEQYARLEALAEEAKRALDNSAGLAPTEVERLQVVYLNALQSQMVQSDALARLDDELDQVGDRVAPSDATTIATTGSTEAANEPQAETPYRLRHFVRLVVGPDRWTFQGKAITREQLPERLRVVADRANTVLELAYTAEGIKLPQPDEVQLLMLTQQLGFAYLSYIGVHPLGSTGSPSLMVPAKAPSTQPAGAETAGHEQRPNLLIETRFVTLPASSDPAIRELIKFEAHAENSGATETKVLDAPLAEQCIQAIRSEPRASMIASPRILTMSGEQACVTVRGREPVTYSPDQVSPQDPLSSLSRPTAASAASPGGLSMSVTPTLAEDGQKITLKLELSREEPIDSANWTQVYAHYGPAESTLEPGRTLAVRLPLIRSRVAFVPVEDEARTASTLYTLKRERLDPPVPPEQFLYVLLKVERVEPGSPSTRPAEPAPDNEAGATDGRAIGKWARHLRETRIPEGVVRGRLPLRWGVSDRIVLDATDGKFTWRDGAQGCQFGVDDGNVLVNWWQADGQRGELRAAVIEFMLKSADTQPQLVDVVDGRLRLQGPNGYISGVEIVNGRLRLMDPEHARIIEAERLEYDSTPPATQSATDTISVHGVVQLPDGTPAAGAEVVIVAPGHEARFAGARYLDQINSQNEKPLSGMSVRTDLQGRFRFPEECEGLVLVAVHEQGYGEARRQTGSNAYELRLEPWARVEGKLYRGQKLSGHRRVECSSASAYDAGGQLKDPWDYGKTTARIQWKQTITTDANGAFKVEQVPAGQCWLRPEMSYGIMGGDTVVEPTAGKTLRVSAGASRTVTGRLVTDAQSGVTITPENTQFRVILYPPAFSGTMEGIEASGRAYGEFLKTPEGQPYARDPAPLAVDGSFTLEDLPPGRYLLQAWVFNMARKPDSSPDEAPVRQGQPIASLDRPLMVEDHGAGPGQAPMELGDLEVHAAGRIASESAASRPQSERMVAIEARYVTLPAKRDRELRDWLQSGDKVKLDAANRTAILDRRQTDELFNRIGRMKDSTVVDTPRLTVFERQTASIDSTRLEPLSAAPARGQRTAISEPARMVRAGTQLAIRPVITADQRQINLEVMGSIWYPTGSLLPRAQHMWTVDLTRAVEPEQTLLIWAPAELHELNEMNAPSDPSAGRAAVDLVTGRALAMQPQAEQYGYLLLKPRIRPASKTAPTASRAAQP